MGQQASPLQFSSRYRALIIFITLFVVSIVSVLALNFYISRQFESDAQDINLAGRQRMLSQRTVKSLQDIQKAEQSGESIESAFTELQNSFELFDTTLNGFDTGGEVQSASGEKVVLSAVSVAEARRAVNDAQTIWTDYRAAINSLIESDVTALQELANATRLALDSNDTLLTNMNSLTLVLERSGSEARYINLAGRQRLLSQLITKALLETSVAQVNNTTLEKPLGELSNSVDLFDSTLNAFSVGGTNIGADGQSVVLAAIDNQEARLLIDQTREVWVPLRDQVQRVLNGDIGALQSLSTAIDFASSSNVQMLGLMNDLTVALQNDSSLRSEQLRYIQVVGIAISLLMFSIILFYFLRQLRKNDAELDQAKAETDQIMATVNDGLFLMDKDFSIGTQHSDSIVDILDQKKLAGQNFLSILRKIVPEKTLKTAEDYLGLLFGDRVNEELVTDLNPLDEVEVYIDSGAGEHKIKHLEFSFKRTRVGDKISHLLVQVDDISERIVLERELKESQEKAQQQFDLMLKVLHVEPVLLGEFLSGTESSLDEINEVLRERSRGPQQNRAKLDRIFRVMHTIKGDAAALELAAFVEKAHDFENMLDGMRENDALQGSDFLPLTIKLDEFLSQIESLRSLIERLSDLQAVVRKEELVDDFISNNEVDVVVDSIGASPSSNVTMESKLARFADRLAEEQGKRVEFSLSGEQQLPVSYHKTMNEILTQLLRNSLVHGIESPEQRKSSNKPEDGSIKATVNVQPEGGYEMIFHDDGRGLSVERIKQSAIKKGMLTELQAAELNDRQVVGLILKPGFSTAERVDEHAGRGVGMDVILAKVRELGGKLKIKYADGKFCEFRVSLPELKMNDKDEWEMADALNDSR